MTFHWNSLDDTDAHRAAAMDRANRGHGSGKHGVKVYATTRAMDEARGGSSEGEQVAYCIRDAWRIDRDNALHAFRVALYGDEFEGVEL